MNDTAYIFKRESPKGPRHTSAIPAPDPSDLVISTAGELGLLDAVFARINYGFGAMVVVAQPFIAWYAHDGNDPTWLIVWAASYLLGYLAVRRIYRRFDLERSCHDNEAVLRRWLPIVQFIAFTYGLSMAVPPLVTARNVSFEFQLLYLISVAAIVAGHSVQSSAVLSVFRIFLVSAWGGVILTVPYTFPGHWYYVLPLTLIFTRTMQKHAATSNRFVVQNIALREQAARLAESFRLAKVEAEQALDDKNRFLTTASHDLRQPVHAMGFLVESIAYRNLDAALVPALNDLRRSVRSLNLMFNSLLDLSKIESGAVVLNPTTVALDPLIQEVATLFREEARTRGLALRMRVTRGASVIADPLLLRQSLVNLVQNALRYTSRGGLLISVRRRGNDWLLEVWDTGIGIANEDKGKIFSPFFRNQYAWRIDNAGHGLGLSVVARCVALMGARLGFSSIDGRGSRFWIRLLAGESRFESAAMHSAEQAARQTQIGGRCLIIEDDLLAAAGWISLMEAWGIEVRCVSSGLDAMTAINDGFEPQVILSDQRLRAGESGFDVLRALLQRLPNATGAMVSGEYDSEELKQAESEGYLVLRKPVDTTELHTILTLWLAEDRGKPQGRAKGSSNQTSR